MPLFEGFLAQQQIPNAFVHAEKLPGDRKPVWPGAYAQWSEFWADEYIVRHAGPTLS